MSITRTALAAATLTLAATLAPAPANAAVIGGSVKHSSPDEGYDSALIVMCDGGKVRTVPEGEHSDDICGDEDVDKIKVRADEEWLVKVRRRAGVSWIKAYDAEGWHSISNLSGGTYVLTRD